MKRDTPALVTFHPLLITLHSSRFTTVLRSAIARGVTSDWVFYVSSELAPAPARRCPTCAIVDGPARPGRLVAPLRPRAAAVRVLPVPGAHDHALAPVGALERRCGSPRHDPARDRPRLVSGRRARGQMEGRLPPGRRQAGAVLLGSNHSFPRPPSAAISIGLRALRLVGRPSPADAQPLHLPAVQRPSYLPRNPDHDPRHVISTNAKT